MAAPLSAFPTETRFYGVDPVVVLNDGYNAMDDYIKDAMDAMERTLVRDLAAIDHGGSAADRRTAEIEKGCDDVMHRLREAVDRNYDKFELYALKNILRLPEEVAAKVDAGALAPDAAPATSSGTCDTAGEGPHCGVVTAEEEAATRARIEALQTEVIMERGRRRALEGLHRHLSQKLPQYAHEVEAMESMVGSMHSTVAASLGDGASLGVVVENTKRLGASVDHLRSILPK